MFLKMYQQNDINSYFNINSIIAVHIRNLKKYNIDKTHQEHDFIYRVKIRVKEEKEFEFKDGIFTGDEFIYHFTDKKEFNLFMAQLEKLSCQKS